MLIAPSLLAADFANLQRDIEMVNESQADWFHLDIMDGLFVPNISYGMPVVKAIKEHAKKPLDVHLMIVDPDRYIHTFAQLGSYPTGRDESRSCPKPSYSYNSHGRYHY